MNFKLNKIVFADIETVSIYASLHDADEQTKKLWNDNYLKLYSEYESPEQCYLGKSAFHPEFSKVVCVSIGYDNQGQLSCKSYDNQDERKLLLDVRNALDRFDKNGYLICGHNIKNFDIPFLGRRYLINGLDVPNCFPSHSTKPWDVKVLDTMDIWKFGAFKNGFGSLDIILQSLGLQTPKDGDITGSTLHDAYWNKKDYEGIRIYCEKDIKALYDMLVYLNNLG